MVEICLGDICDVYHTYHVLSWVYHIASWLIPFQGQPCLFPKRPSRDGLWPHRFPSLLLKKEPNKYHDKKWGLYSLIMTVQHCGFSLFMPHLNLPLFGFEEKVSNKIMQVFFYNLRNTKCYAKIKVKEKWAHCVPLWNGWQIYVQSYMWLWFNWRPLIGW